MPQFNINLAKGSIWPRWKRVMAYRLIWIYLLIMALLLALLAVHSVQRVFSGIIYYSQGRSMDQQFAQDHPNGGPLLDHAKLLKTNLEKDAARIDSINDALPPALHTPLPALFLLANQPDESALRKFSFSQQTENTPVQLRLDLITPISSKNGTSYTKLFQEKWQNDPVLAQQFPNVKQLQVRRAKLASGSVLIIQYEALSKD